MSWNASVTIPTIPFTSDYELATAFAYCALAVVFSAIVWHRPLKDVTSSMIFVLAVWLSSPLPLSTGLAHLTPIFFRSSVALAAFALLLSDRRLGLVAVGSGVLLWWIASPLIQQAGYMGWSFLGQLHLLWLGLLLAFHLRSGDRPQAEAGETKVSYVRDDWIVFLAGTFLASVASVFLIERFCVSGDEIGYTFQADLFAHFKAYAHEPQCADSFWNKWVLPYHGRKFSQYTPGWPLFMAPFFWVHAPWIAGPISLGLLMVGVARLSRRLMVNVSARSVRLAGVLGAIMIGSSYSGIVNGASRYPHVFVAATFAWAIESILALSAGAGSRKRWGLLLGLSSAMLIATRPSDAAALGLAIAVLFIHALIKREIRRDGVISAALSFGCIIGVTLILLRLQLGAWFKTGYSITGEILGPSESLSLSVPTLQEVPFNLPLGIGSYCWWPCAPALGLAGLIRARGSKALRACLIVGTVAVWSFYFFVDWMHGPAWGYGPRYLLSGMVAMAVGGASLVAPLFSRSLRASAPGLLVAVAMVVGVGGLVPSMYLPVREGARRADSVVRAIDREGIHHAVVLINEEAGEPQPYEINQNSPTDPDPDVLILRSVNGETDSCVRRMYPDRQFYRAIRGMETKLIPE